MSRSLVDTDYDWTPVRVDPSSVPIVDICSEAGAAERFARQHGTAVRFDHRRGCWFIWDWHRWTPDADAAVTAAMTTSRVPGRGRLLCALRTLLRRVQRFSEHRATGDAEQQWAARIYDALEAAYTTGLAAPGARVGLDAVDRRRASSRKSARRTP